MGRRPFGQKIEEIRSWYVLVIVCNHSKIMVLDSKLTRPDIEVGTAMAGSLRKLRGSAYDDLSSEIEEYNRPRAPAEEVSEGALLHIVRKNKKLKDEYWTVSCCYANGVSASVTAMKPTVGDRLTKRYLVSLLLKAAEEGVLLAQETELFEANAAFEHSKWVELASSHSDDFPLVHFANRQAATVRKQLEQVQQLRNRMATFMDRTELVRQDFDDVKGRWYQDIAAHRRRQTGHTEQTEQTEQTVSLSPLV